MDVFEEYYLRNKFEIDLNEGLISSYPINNVIADIHSQLLKTTIEDKKDNEFHIGILPEFDLEDFNKLKRLLDRGGWKIVGMDIITHVKILNDKYNESKITKLLESQEFYKIRLLIHAKFDIKMSNKFLPEYLYHVTPLKNWPRIQKKGLIPRSEAKRTSHPERVYFGFIEDKMEDLARRMKTTNSEINWVLLRVETKHLPDYTTFYKDPNYQNGVYTYNNIAPYDLEFVKSIDIS